ncbi:MULTISPECIES: thiamine pyrophosphate-dependent dehydrogenase E1 component subunit alpha [unclassified Corallococcus]|uniref:thiamine pyrophosphate-dependent dehydrogenase E1 component subunit alpha n=1 Tax=unclassified Corallococcus TaxID=2685029 RepID=UPI000EA158E6|nr:MULTISPECIES: thiamine pyrophosphate-dependent dehydrogenase E1 component subunit alpha [unclassified Corallococcus]MBN9684596.1 thiamine pyrophosphate-dependent dehydrogenase E1 component subunit alpha [Corallococcus sp. NCSPR001]NOJ95942.1 thiamine pyrophosphate-dependent dehydrogenase E1 component subunit alpha [Corallococcus coralloides]RKG83954.1 thiamine pyrophosphate-dependent dehydrogenase E1 component subunit alpha [Corallococcus sp. CA049B]WAS83932.1 thiamine pyrophosphate-dependen
MSRPRLIKENSAPLSLPREQLIRIHDLMVKARVLEERLIQMYKQGHGYFWIGGPGEEAFNVPLGLLMKVGEGPAYDYLHAHYRQSATLLAMGEEPIGALRQMKNTATDPYSGGRNFAGHFSRRSKNIAPVTSPIEVQYAVAPGTAMAQKRHGGDGITIVTGGDAGTAEGDFASCLIWSSRPANPLPILIIVTNNKWGISTTSDGQHGETNISDRARAFNIQAKTINGNDPVESYQELQAAMEYVRKERKPFFIEARVSRLYGHSSASGANFVNEEQDCLRLFEARLEQEGVLSREQMDEARNRYSEELAAAARTVRDEPQPSGDSIWEHIYAEKK